MAKMHFQLYSPLHIRHSVAMCLKSFRFLSSFPISILVLVRLLDGDGGDDDDNIVKRRKSTALEYKVHIIERLQTDVEYA